MGNYLKVVEPPEDLFAVHDIESYHIDYMAQIQQLEQNEAANPE